jgi:hypothetical protein
VKKLIEVEPLLLAAAGGAAYWLQRNHKISVDVPAGFLIVIAIIGSAMVVRLRFTDRHKSASANKRGAFLALGSWLPYASTIVGLTWVSSWLIGRLVVNDAAAGSLGAIAVTLIVKFLDKVPDWVDWLRPWKVGRWAIQKRYGTRFKSNRGTDIFGNGYRAVWVDQAVLAYPNPIVINGWNTSERKDRYDTIGTALRS